MRITAPQPALKRAVALATISAGPPGVESKNTSAAAKALQTALAAILIEADDSGIFVSCCDRMTSIRAHVGATIIEPGSFATSAAKMLSLIAAFPADASITITDTGSVTAGASCYRLIPIVTDRLPARFVFDNVGAAVVAIGAPTMARLLEPAPAANREESRTYLNGIAWRSDGPMLVAVATDGAVLIRTAIEAPTFTTSSELIVPSATVAILRKLLTLTKPGALTLSYNGRLLMVGCGAFELISILVAGKYPETNALLPKPAATVVCDRRSLVAALQRMAAAANSVEPLMAATFAEGILKLFLAREPLIGSDTLAAKTTGSGQFAAMLAQFVRMIDEIEGAEIEIGAEGNIRIRCPGDGGKLGMIASTTVSPAVWESAP